MRKSQVDIADRIRGAAAGYITLTLINMVLLVSLWIIIAVMRLLVG